MKAKNYLESSKKTFLYIGIISKTELLVHGAQSLSLDAGNRKSMLINVVSKNLTNQRPPIPVLSIQRQKAHATFPSPARNIMATA